MACYRAAFAAAILFTGITLSASAGRAQSSGTGCSPNGRVFNLQGPKNAVGQFNETVAVLPGAGAHGTDLVFGTALDARALPPLGFLPGQDADAFYVQRANSACAADVEGEMPPIQSNTGDVYNIFGNPVVTADPARGAFFAADLRYSGQFAVGVMKATRATLLNTSACPNGTEANPAACFVPVAQLANIVSLNSSSGLFSPSLSVDQRTAGTGAGDVYIAVAQNNADGTTASISLSACANTLRDCSRPMVISGSDTRTSNPWVAVRPDGGVTVSYVEREANTPVSAMDIRFVNCQPGGSPNAPTCTAPAPVIREPQPAGVPGEVLLSPQYVNPLELAAPDLTYPKHVDRLESDGTTVTTFLVYDRCETSGITGDEIFVPLCPKTDVVILSTTDGGATWSPAQKVSNASGQQFFGNLALDASTGTVNIAYYSTENDALKTAMQIFLAQVAPGETSPGAPVQITATLYDGPLGGFNGDEELPGSYLGIAAGGTGQPGQSRVYIHFSGSVTPGNYDGVLFPVANDILTSLQY
ncbi:MAG TPA: hypothetical protein VMG35_28640 [Bryobacteraceae bacterium]|nr:hypothetical protein [Bryobacteraceae bacterium]